jgi:hypothetical protein
MEVHTTVPPHPYFEVVWDVQGRVCLDELEGLADNRESHGTRRKNPIACGVNPFVYPVY